MEDNIPRITKVPIFGDESIHIGPDLLSHILSDLTTATPSTHTYVLIADKNVADLHLTSFTSEWECFKTPLPKLLTYTIPPGETSKSYTQKGVLDDFLFSSGCGRDTCLIALGGGVVGDLVGYVASTFMRGVPLIQIPTTLLAMVDSAIGGKNGINVPAGKNLIGTIWQPRRVYINLDYLETLPQREIANGMAEIIKAAVVSNAAEFQRIESMAPDTRSLFPAILEAVKFKARIVTADERESGLRELLNFGHTIGHGIEALLAPSLLHGECVAIGMCAEAEIGLNLEKCNSFTLERLRQVLEAFGLPISLDDPTLSSALTPSQRVLPLEQFMVCLAADKKGRGGQKRMILLQGIGVTAGSTACAVSNEDILRVMAPCVQIQKIPTTRPTHISLAVPGSKSVSNRALLLAALGQGTCALKGLLHSDDTKYMIKALKALTDRKFMYLHDTNILSVCGVAGQKVVTWSRNPSEIYLGNCGTAARFLTSTAVIAARESRTAVVLTGNKRMKERPIGPLVEALRTNGAEIEYLENNGCLPLRILPAKNGLSGGVIRVSAKLSSQYVSSLLMAAPFATGDYVTLELVGEHVSSQPYIDITLAVMASFGVNVERTSDRIYVIPSCSPRYVNPPKYLVEGDASSATYPLAVAAITGTSVTVTNLGSNSLQGDAHFAKKVLETMGATVTQDELTTTVKGPPLGSLRSLPPINMDSMTDAFLTASVLAATAGPRDLSDPSTTVTSITGIANTRVKECDRIAVAVEQLKGFGVDAWETEDGLEIRGKPLATLEPAHVHCWEDHRVSMAFSVLGAVVPGTVILDKACVAKSWPGWWTALGSTLQVPLQGLSRLENKVSGSPSISPVSSVVLIGMKKAGKTTFGKLAAKALGMGFIDMDDVFQNANNWDSIKQFIDHQGWESFRATEASLLAQALQAYPTNTIIATGGGVVELEENRKELKDWRIRRGGIVIHVDSDWNEMDEHFKIDGMPYAGSEPFIQVAKRRAHLYRECSNYYFWRETMHLVNHETENGTRDLVRLIRFIRGEVPCPLPAQSLPLRRSFFLCIAMHDVSMVQDKLDTMINGFHAVELRIDHLKQPNVSVRDFFKFSAEGNSLLEFESYVSGQVALLRRAMGAVAVPVIYTLRTISEGGLIPDDIDPAHLTSLYELGLRLGCEIIDVQLSTFAPVFSNLIRSNFRSKVIASVHKLNGPINWAGSEATKLYTECAAFGHVVKLVGGAGGNNHDCADFQEKCAIAIPPLIALNLGVGGQSTRVSNKYLTPATHPDLPHSAALGQLTLTHMNQWAAISGDIAPLKFYIFGHGIQYSKSPLLHNNIFKSFGLPHVYNVLDTQDLTRIAAVLTDSSFGGASVTIPHKETILALVDKVSEAVKGIGAMNTVTRDLSTGTLLGDNTDWLGIKAGLDRAHAQGSCLVLGSGGTARAAIYAAYKSGLKDIYVANRTKERMDKMIQHFKQYCNLDVKAWTVDAHQISMGVVIDTCPGNAGVCTPELINQVFSETTPGILVRLAYNVEDIEYAANVTLVTGLDVLVDQAIEQSVLWTGLRPSRQLLVQILRLD